MQNSAASAAIASLLHSNNWHLAMKTCPVCSTAFEDDLGFCRKDGTPLLRKAAERVCSRCGKEVEEDKTFCGYCGASVGVPKAVQSEDTTPAAGAEPTTTELDSGIQAAERLISEGHFQEAISNLEKILKENPDNNEAGLIHLLACVKHYNIYGYEKQIESIKGLPDLTEKERGLAREIFLLAAEESRKTGKEEKAREYQRLATRVILGQISTEVPSEIRKETPAPKTKEAQFSIPQELSYVRANRKAVGAPARQPRPITERQRTRGRGSRLAVSFVLVLGLVGVLVAGMLGYYAKEKGLKITEIFNRPPAPLPSATNTSDAPAVAQVVGAKELGLTISGPGAGDVNRQSSVISEDIESQLTNLRQMYQQELQGKPDLLGSITLQLTISPSGTVTRVDEFASRIKDKEFKNSVVAEAYKWRFREAGSGLVKVNYPVLFVPAGMDIDTMIKLEQVTSPTEKEPAVPRPPAPGEKPPVPQPPVYPPPPLAPPPPPPPPPPEPVVKLTPYEVLYPTSVFSEPRETSRRVAWIEAGTKVNVASVQGDWLEVRSKQGRPPGFIKRESAVPMTGR
jgi:predicted nucleic acid-binding Zn ribbon protein